MVLFVKIALPRVYGAVESIVKLVKESSFGNRLVTSVTFLFADAVQ
jgi:hypothetical protein